MKSLLIGAAAAALALLVYLLWPAATVEPRPTTEPTAAEPVPPAPEAAVSRPAADAPEAVRRAVESPHGPTGARITVVWEDDRAPVSSMPVRVYRMQGKAYAAVVAHAVTDAGGVVTFADLDAGEYAFFAARAREKAVVEPGTCVEVELVLRVAAEASGVVVDAAGTPVADAVLAAVIAGYPQPVATSGAAGRFELRLAQPSRIWASKEGHVPSPQQAVKSDTEDLVLQLGAADAWIDGLVVDPDGRPVARATVAVAIDLDGSRGRLSHVMLEADDRGRFETTRLPRGELVVYAHAERFAFGQQDVDTTDSGSAHVVVSLRRAASIHGRLLGGEAGDEPQVGVPIIIHRQRDLPGLLTGTSDSFTRFDVVTDHDGRYRITGIPPGRMWVAAMVRPSPVHHNVELAEGEDHEWNPDLSRPSGVIRGVLQGPDGAPLAGWRVSATRIDFIEMERELVRAETDADGRFEIEELRPLPHTVSVDSPGGESVARRTEVQPDQPAFVWRLAGLPSQSGEIVGRVLGPDGEPVVGAAYRASHEGISRRSSSVEDADGGFRIPRVFPGIWRVVGELDGYGSFDLGPFEVRAGATVDAGARRLQPRGAVVVRVSGQGFAPAGIDLALEQVEGGDNESAEFTADAGALRSPPLPPGRYRLRARGRNFAPSARDVTIQPGVDAEVDLPVAPTTTVKFEFVPEDLSEPAWNDFVDVRLHAADGELILRHTHPVDGAPTGTFTVGLAAGTYRIEASSPNVVYRRGEVEFVVPAEPTGRCDVRVPLEVQRR